MLPGTVLVEITNNESKQSPSMSMKSGAAGSVKWRSRGRPMDSAKAMVDWVRLSMT